MTHHELRPTPDQPIFYGQIHFGTFREPFRAVNLIDADIVGHRWAPRWWRNLRLREWQHFGIVHDEFYCGCAIVNAKFAAYSFVYLYNRVTGEMVAHQHAAMPRGAIHLPEQLWCEDGFFRRPGYHIRVQNCLDEQRHLLQIDIHRKRKALPIRAEFTIHERLDHVQPLIAVLPVNDHRRPLYAHKAACSVEGQLQVGSQAWTEIDGQALVDVQKAYFPRAAFWNWAACAGYDQAGVPVALNLTHNVIEDDETWNTNGAWIDGRLIRFGAARFTFDPADMRQPWRILTTDAKVELTFTPEGEHAEPASIAGLVRADCRQFFGTYHGTVIDDAGQDHNLNGAFGVAEDQQSLAIFQRKTNPQAR